MKPVEPPVPTESVHTRTVQRAAELLGDEAVLAAFLGVSWSRLKQWLTGAEATPQSAFMMCVDIVNNESRIVSARLKAAEDKLSAVRTAAAVRSLIKSA
jgi:hypothetical protein